MALKFGTDFLRLVLPKRLEYKFGITPKPMKFPVGEGLPSGEAKKALEVITKKPEVVIGKEPQITQRQALQIFPKYVTQQIAEKRGEIPKTKISPELAREASKQLAWTAFGATAPLAKTDTLVKNYLSKNVSTEAQQAIKTGIKQRFSDVYTAIVDRFNPIVKMARKIPSLKPGENPEILSRRYLGIKGISESKLYWKTFDVTPEGNLKITGEGLGNTLKPLRNNLDDLRALMIAERDIELASRGIKGVPLSESKNILNALKTKYGENYQMLDDTSKGVRDFTRRAVLNPLKDIGAISEKTYNKIIQSNQFYTPFKRVMGDLERQGYIPAAKDLFSPKAVPIKAIKGSERQIIDPLESIIQDVYRVTDFVEREGVAKSIVGLRNFSDELAGMIKPVKPLMKPITEKGEVLTFRPLPYTAEKNTIQVFENGVRKFYQVPEDLAKAMNTLSYSGANMLMKILGFPAKTLRAGATLTPEFIGRNPIRDQFTAMVFSKYGYRPPIDFTKGIWSVIGKGDLFYRWQASGGAHSMFVSLDRISNQKTLADLIMKSATTGQKVAYRGVQLKTYNPLEALRALSEFGEKGTRIGAYKRALQKGVSELEAGFEARDITLDFSRLGSQTKEVNRIIAFWNANVQGIDKMVRAFKERPLQTSTKAILGITVPSIGLYLVNKDNPRYRELPQWQKDLFWIIIPPGEKSPIIRIPKPFELGIIFGTVPEHILAWLEKNEPEQLTTIPGALARGASPGLIPNIMLPILENQANYSFFRDRPIISQSIENLPPELQANTYTSETTKEIGKIIKQSPAKIENLVWGYFAGMGGYGLDVSDAILKSLNVVSPPEQPTKTTADIPFLKAFTAREPIGSASESVNKFYDILETARQTKNAVEEFVKQGKEDEAVKYLKEHKEGFYIKGLEKVARDFSQIRKQKDLVYNDRNLTPEQKKRAIDALDKVMTEMAHQALELIKQSQ